MELDLFLLFSSLPTTFIFFCVDDADRDDDAATACNGGVTVLLRFFFYSPDVLSEHFCGPLSKRDDPRAHAKIIYS